MERVPTHIDGEPIPTELRVRMYEEASARHAAAFRARVGAGQPTALERAADRSAGEQPANV